MAFAVQYKFSVTFTDIEGRWKMLHYYARDFFAPVIVTPHLSVSNELSIYIVSDVLYVLTNCTIEIRVYEWKAIEPVFIRSYNDIIIVSNKRLCISCTNINMIVLIFLQEPLKATKITSFWLNAFLEQAGCGSLESAKKSCIATLSLTDESGSLIAPVNYVYPDVLKNTDIPVANVTVSKSWCCI